MSAALVKRGATVTVSKDLMFALGLMPPRLDEAGRQSAEELASKVR